MERESVHAIGQGHVVALKIIGGEIPEVCIGILASDVTGLVGDQPCGVGQVINQARQRFGSIPLQLNHGLGNKRDGRIGNRQRRRHAIQGKSDSLPDGLRVCHPSAQTNPHIIIPVVGTQGNQNV